MAFDAIETTVANALLLKAQLGETDPVRISLKPFSDLSAYSERLKQSLTLSSLLQEPLGKHFFKKFLITKNKESVLDICTEIRHFRSCNGKAKRIRGRKIIVSLRGKHPHVEEIRSTLEMVNSQVVEVTQQVPESLAESKAEQQSGSDAIETKPEPQAELKDDINSLKEADMISKEEQVPEKKLAVDTASDLIKNESPLPELTPSNAIIVDPLLEPKKASNEKVEKEEEKEDETGVAIQEDSVADIESSEKAKQNSASATSKVADGDKQYPNAQTIPAVDEEPPQDDLDAIGKRSSMDIPTNAIVAMENALKTPELFDTDQMADMFDIVYVSLYSQMSNIFYPQFLESGKLFEYYIRFREYAETSEVGFDSFQMFRALGKGAFGMVSAVQKKDTKKIYAMKQMKKKKIKHYHSEKLCDIEKSALQKMDSPFVLNLKYSFTHDKSLFLILELCNGGDLQFHLQEVRAHRFSEERARFYAAEVILALEHLHTKKYVYRDLKPGNILLDNNGHVVLSDLGLVHRVSSKRPLRTLAGTAGYWAPEVMKREWYDYAADWWSFGIFLHKLLSGRRPRCDCKRSKQWCPFGTKKEHPESAKAGEPMSFQLTFDGPLFSPDAQDLLRKLIEPDQTKRLGSNGSTEVKAHPFFKSISWGDLEEQNVDPPFRPTKHDINAVSLAEISSEGDRKFKKVHIDEKDERFYERWPYKSVKTIQEEIVEVLVRNKELEKNVKPVSKAPPKKSCCAVQ